MWLEQEKFHEIDHAICRGERRSLLRVLGEFFHPENQSYSSFIKVCPQCKKPLVRKMLPYLEYVVSACPDRHGAWVSPEVTEKMRDFMQEEILRSTKRSQLIQLTLLGCGLFFLFSFGMQAASFLSSQQQGMRSKVGNIKNERAFLAPLPNHFQGIENPMEVIYLKQAADLIEQAAKNRAAFDEFLTVNHPSEENWAAFEIYQKNHVTFIEKLRAIPVPPVLNEFHQLLQNAAAQQLIFYAEFLNRKSGNRMLSLGNLLKHPALQSSNQALLQAYHLLLKQYPNLDSATSRALESRLCWLDIL